MPIHTFGAIVGDTEILGNAMVTGLIDMSSMARSLPLPPIFWFRKNRSDVLVVAVNVKEYKCQLLSSGKLPVLASSTILALASCRPYNTLASTGDPDETFAA